MSDDAVTVRASGVDERPPDLAVVVFEVRASAEEPSVARAETDERTRTLFETLDEWGVPDEDVGTVAYRLHEPRPGSQGTESEDGYVASHQVRVEATDVEAVGPLVTACVDASEAGVSGLDHDLTGDSRREARRAALDDAMSVAREQATTLAAAAERPLGGVRSVETTEPHGVRTESGRVDTGEVVTDVRPGPVETTATVEVVFELE